MAVIQHLRSIYSLFVALRTQFPASLELFFRVYHHITTSTMTETRIISLPNEELKKEITPSVRVGSTSTEEAEKSLQFTEIEHGMGFWQAAKLHWPAICWGLFINLATVLKGIVSLLHDYTSVRTDILTGMDGAIVGSLIGLDP